MGKTINIKNLYLAEITEEENSLNFGKPEIIPGLRKATRKPSIAKGTQYGDGKLEDVETAKTSYEIAIDHNNIPQKWRSWLEGLAINNGVESGTSTDQGKPFAMGWEIEKVKGAREMIWFIYCQANPIEDTDEQREDNIKISHDTISITAFEHSSVERYYTKINSQNKDVTKEMLDNFFAKVQTTDTIEKPTEPAELTTRKTKV